MWLEYAYRELYQVLQFRVLPVKLAEWIGENMQDELEFPDKQDPANRSCCGALGGASLVWGVCQCLRLRYGEWL